MKQKMNFDKLEIKENGQIKKKRNTIKHSKENALEKHEQEELLRTVKSLDIPEKTKERYLVMILLLMNGGLRISEAIQTRLDWFNETKDGMTLNIPPKARDMRNLKRDWTPKTEKGAREVLFLDQGVGEKIRSFFVNNTNGLNMSRQRAGQIIKMLGISMEKPGLHPHALRSTYANNLVYAGVNESTLTYYMGWANIQTAINYVRTSKIAARADLIQKFNIGE